MNIGIVGRGRLGMSLEHLFEHASASVHVAGRQEALPAVDAVLLCVPDAAIAHVARTVAAEQQAGTPILHASGAQTEAVLRPHSPAGVWHPLMTFPGFETHVPRLEGVAVRLGGDAQAIAVGRAMAALVGAQPFELPAHADVALYHAAAAVAGNLTSVLAGCAQDVAEKSGMPADIAEEALLRLAETALANRRRYGAGSLTGPMTRGDQGVVESHLQALRSAGFSRVLEVYERLAEEAKLHQRPDRSERKETS